jgi:hypothetical protein
MSPPSVRLLEAACGIVGGRTALAERLGIDEVLLERYMNGRRALPDALLLRAVDIILADRQLPLTVRLPLKRSPNA